MRSSKRPIRGVVAMAATFVFTLVGYLFLTAVPAFAAPIDCDVSLAPDGGPDAQHIVITVHTDSRVAFAINYEDDGFGSGDYLVFDLDEPTDGWEQLDCDTNAGSDPVNKFGGLDWVDIRGSNAGNEHVTLVTPLGQEDTGRPGLATENMDTEVWTINLGSGSSDSVTLEYGDFDPVGANDADSPVSDPENEDDPGLLTADGESNLHQGTEQVVDFGDTGGDDSSADSDTDGDGDLRIDGGELMTVNTGEEPDDIRASDANIDWRFGPDDTTSADDIPDADGLGDDDADEEDEGDDSNGACDGKPFNLAVTMNGEQDDDNFESGLQADVISGGPGDDEVDYDGQSVALGSIVFCDGPGGVTVDLDTVNPPNPTPPAAGGATGAYGADVLNDIQDIEGSPHDDTLLGNDLDNDIRGNTGDDYIDGAAGDDNDDEGTDEDDAGIDGGLEGDGPQFGAPLAVNPADCTPIGANPSCDDEIFGGSGDDNLEGGPDDDELTGGSGADEVDGDDGDDIVHEEAANSGTDDLDGGDDSDVLDYSLRTTPTAVIANGQQASGQDINADGDAADTGEERDLVQDDFEGYVTGSANDTLIGDGSGESFQGNAGDDVIDGSLISGFDQPSRWDFDLDYAVYTSDYGTCTAGIVATMATGVTPGSVTGGCGTDSLIQVEGVIGTDFDDVFNDDVDTDNDYAGLDGDDTFVQPQDPTGPNSDSDFIEGGEGTGDFLDLSSRTGDIEGDMDGEGTCEGTFPVDCDYFPDADFDDGDEDGAGDGEDDNWSETLEHITTGSGEDVITANDFNNNVDTGSGNDEAHGDGGNDVFAGGLGDDEVFGGDGNDLMETLEPAAAAPGDSFGDGADVFDGENGFDRYDARGRTASQNLTSDASCFQDDGLFGEGDGLCFVEGILGGSGDDFIAGDNANNTLNGFGGADNIQGLKGRDRIVGGTGDDRMTGGKGPDALIGGKGFDTGNGNQGADTCQSVENATSCHVVQQA